MWRKNKRDRTQVYHPYTEQCPFSHKKIPQQNRYLTIFKTNLAGLILSIALVLTMINIEVHPIEISLGPIMIFSAWLIIGPKLNIYMACAYPLLHVCVPHHHDGNPLEFISGPLILITGLTINWSIHKLSSWCIKDSWFKLMINCCLMVIFFMPCVFGIHYLSNWAVLDKKDQIKIIIFTVVKTLLSTGSLLISFLMFCSICKIVEKITPNWKNNY